MTSKTETFEGGCTCRQVRYRLTSRPLFVHCCHCRWCQRDSGTAFAMNAMIEAERVESLGGDVEVIDTPTLSGKGQKISRCPKCRIAVWSNYSGAGPTVHFVRVGTLDEPDRLPPGTEYVVADVVADSVGAAPAPRASSARKDGLNLGIERCGANPIHCLICGAMPGILSANPRMPANLAAMDA